MKPTDRYSWFDAREEELKKEAKARYPNNHLKHLYESASDRYVDVYHKLYCE
jgi:hypothetical protein